MSGASAKFYVWTNRWREVDVCRGAVSGWRRRARFVFVRRGKLQLAASAPVLRALRALAAGDGRGGAVRCGPRLLLRNFTTHKTKENVHIHELKHCKQTDVAVQCAGAVDVSTQADTLCLNVQARGYAGHTGQGGHEGQGTGNNQYDISTWNNNNKNKYTFDTRKRDTREEQSAKSATKISKPPPKIKTRIVSSDTSLIQNVDIDYNSENEFVEKNVRSRAPALGPLLDAAAAPRARPWRVDSSASPEPARREPDGCKELVISESDVLVLRGLVARTRPAALARFDADERYRRALFYAINPLVELRRCARLERALRERHTRMTDVFAARLGLTRRDTTPSPAGARARKRARRRPPAPPAPPQYREPDSTEPEERPVRSGDGSSTRNVKTPTVTTKRDSTSTPILRSGKTRAKRVSRRISSSDTDKENFTEDRVLRNRRGTLQQSRASDAAPRTLRRRHAAATRDTRSSDTSDNTTLNNMKSVQSPQKNTKHIDSFKNKRKVETSSQTSNESNSHRNKKSIELLNNNKRVLSPRVNKRTVELPENNSNQLESKQKSQKKKQEVKVQKKKISEKKSPEKNDTEQVPPAQAQAQPGDGHTHVISKRASSSRTREYSNLEDHAIVAWVSTGARAGRVNGNQVWRELQEQYERLTGHSRSWHSLRNRYLRYILPALRALHLPPSTEARLRAAAATGSIRRRGVTSSRRNSIFHESTVKSASASASTKHKAQHNTESSPPPARSKPTVAKLTVTAVPTVGRHLPTVDRQSPVRRSPRYSEITRRYKEAPQSSDTSERDSSIPRTVRTHSSTTRAVHTDSPAGRTRTRRLFNPNAVI